MGGKQLALSCRPRRAPIEPCQECGRAGCRIYGDHILELKDGGALLDEDNVLLRCGSCHGRKTAAVRGERRA
jgi:5-methylcytosine-specific restriction enzyme A